MQDGRLPLHMAAANGSSLEVVKLLLEANPEAITTAAKACRSAHTPMLPPQHHSSTMRPSLPCCRTRPPCPVSFDSPRAAQDGPPLLLATASGAPVQVVKLLLDAHPEAASFSSDRGAQGGMMPLHHAAANGASIEVMKLLLKANPKAVTTAVKARCCALTAAHAATQRRVPLLSLAVSYAAPRATPHCAGRRTAAALRCFAERARGGEAAARRRQRSHSHSRLGAPLCPTPPALSSQRRVHSLFPSPKRLRHTYFVAQDGRLPLHMAGNNNSKSLDVVTLLLEAHRKAVTKADNVQHLT